MAVRRALVEIGGELQELAVGDTLGTTLQNAYDDGGAGGGMVNLSVSGGALSVNGLALATGTAGNNDGPDYFAITRDGVNILVTSYNAVDQTALVYSNVPGGLDIGPDPGVLPNRSTISVRPDVLQFLKEDRSFASSVGSGFFRWTSSVTLTGGGTIGGFVTLDGDVIFDGANASGFGMGNALRTGMRWIGVGGTNLGPGFVFAGNNVFRADGGATVMSQARIFFDNATYDVVNGGTLTMGAIGHVSLWCNTSLNAGVTMPLRRGVLVPEMAGSGGTLTTQVGLDIENLARATTNIGIRSAITAANGDFINTIGADGPARFGGEVEIDGALNHDGPTIGLHGATPQTQDTGWLVSNVTTRRTLDASAPTLNDLADLVGTLIETVLKPRGDIGA